MSRTSLIAVYELACPVCGGRLDGLGHDILFTCGRCGLALDPADKSRRTPLVFARPRIDSGGSNLLHLPFWLIDVQPAAFDISDQPLQLKGWLKQIWVSAFWTRATLRYGEPGMALTVERAELEPGGPTGRVAGVARSAREAQRMAHYIQLNQLDHHQDLGDNRIEPELGAPRLVAVPFSVGQSEIVDLLLGHSYSQRILHDPRLLELQAAPQA